MSADPMTRAEAVEILERQLGHGDVSNYDIAVITLLLGCVRYIIRQEGEHRWP